MNKSKRKKLGIVGSSTLLAIGLYVVAYFGCVSVRFGHIVTVKERRIDSAYAYYVGWMPQEGLALFFEPVRFCDEYYFRPGAWADRWHVE